MREIAAVLSAVFLIASSHPVKAAGEGDDSSARLIKVETSPSPTAEPPESAYDPYPAGILPRDLNPEIERVRRELRVIEGRALARWHTLKPPVLTGQPPTFQNTGTEAVETLGELMNYDENISPNRNRACSSATCHTPPSADRSRRSI